MGSKRKLGAQGTPTKKQKGAPAKKKVIDFTKTYSTTLLEVLELKDEDDTRKLAEPFIKLPSKKIYPDYYTIVETPFTIQDVQKKFSKGKYSSSDSSEFVNDFQLIYDNASLFNDPDSWIANDAKKIFAFVEKQVAEAENEPEAESEAAATLGPKLLLKLKKKEVAAAASTADAETESPEVSIEELPELCKKLLDEVIDHKFPGLGVISDPFLDDIDRKDYPDYFKIIENPTSFNKMLAVIKKKGYFLDNKSIEENLMAFKVDTDLIFSNSQLYNDPGSLIYQDSEKLQELFDQKFEDLLTKLTTPVAAKKKRGGLKLKIKNPLAASTGTDGKKLTIKIERRGRKKKVVEPVEPVKQEDEEEPENEEEDNDEENKEGAEEVELKEEPIADIIKEDEAILEEEYNALGKTSKPGDISKSFIQLASICSSQTTISQLHNQNRQNQNNPASLTLGSQSNSMQLKYSLFPSHHPIANVLFEYKFPTRGYADSSHSLSLPADANLLISLKLSLHEILREVKGSKAQFVNSANDDDYQCRLWLNDEEVNTGGEIYEGENDHDANLLNFQYDLKLSQGLNMLSFELKVAPNISKKVKETESETLHDEDEGTGRFTRHQLQQIKMSWDVEKVNFVIVNTLS